MPSPDPDMAGVSPVPEQMCFAGRDVAAASAHGRKASAAVCTRRKPQRGCCIGVVVRSVLHVAWHVACGVLHGVCCMLHVVCCMLHAVRCDVAQRPASWSASVRMPAGIAAAELERLAPARACVSARPPRRRFCIRARARARVERRIPTVLSRVGSFRRPEVSMSSHERLDANAVDGYAR